MLECRGINCSKSAISRLIEKCNNIRQIKQVQSQIITSPFLSINDYSFLVSRLLYFCTVSSFGCLNYATTIFNSIPNPTLFDYTAIIRAFASTTHNSYRYQSLIVYKQMLCEGVKPSNITFTFLIKECVKRVAFQIGRGIHCHVLKLGCAFDVFVQNSLISLYFECGRLDDARRVFVEMPERDVVSWNSMIMGYLRNGELDMALGLFRIMQNKNVITWNSIIVGFVQGGQAKEALELFHEMQVLGDKKFKPDKITIATVVSACASLGSIDHGTWIHSYIKKSLLECDTVMATALLDMYGKCGCVEKVVEVFKGISKKDVFAWTAMIAVFALHGMGKEAFQVFSEMEGVGIWPNAVTFTALLSACAHSGLVERSRWCFDLMKRVYFIEPRVQHYACMVDTLSRAGLFDEAESIIGSMPMEPDVYVWGALLGGCQMHGNVELGGRVAKNLISLEPLNHAFYVDLCDVYAKAGKFGELKKLRALMNDTGIEKPVPGCSMIEINGTVHEFSVKGSCEAVLDNIIFWLARLTNEIKIENYAAVIID